MPKPALHVIPSSAPQDTPAERVRRRIKAMPRPAILLQCRRCGGREFIETKVGVEFVEGRTRGGTKTLLCAGCALNGERIVIL